MGDFRVVSLRLIKASVNPLFSATSPCVRFPSLPTSRFCSSNRRWVLSFRVLPFAHTTYQIVGDDTIALDSVLKADVWRDHLLQEEAALNATLVELDVEGDDKRFVDAREEASSRLAEVHARLADMEAESGPARAAALLAGTCPKILRRYSWHNSVICRPGIQRRGPKTSDEILQWRLEVHMSPRDKDSRYLTHR